MARAAARSIPARFPRPRATLEAARVAAMGVCFAVAFLPQPVGATVRVHLAVGVAQTGPNNTCGSQVWTLQGLPAGPASSGLFLGREDTSVGAVLPFDLTPTACDPVMGNPAALVATRYDDAFGALRGWIAPDEALENLSLRRIPVPAGNGVRAPIPLPGSVPPNPLPPTITKPTDPISIGSWLAADGDLEIVCDDSNNTATIAAQMSNLIPNGVYTMWAHWSEGIELLQVPFGGLPNTLVADGDGQAEFCREVEFCPLDLAPDSSSMQFVSAVYMGDGTTYGAVPSEPFATRAFLGVEPLPFLSTIPGGIVSFDQLGFRINATGGPDPGLSGPMMCQPAAMSVASMPRWGIGLICVLMTVMAPGRLRRRAARRDASAL